MTSASLAVSSGDGITFSLSCCCIRCATRRLSPPYYEVDNRLST
jgi:hypothetical protein